MATNEEKLQDLANHLYYALEGLLSIHCNHPTHPELDTEEARKSRTFSAVAKAAQASEHYERHVFGQDIGCVPRIEDELDRLRKIEAAAREYRNVIDDLDRQNIIEYRNQKAANELLAIEIRLDELLGEGTSHDPANQ